MYSLRIYRGTQFALAVLLLMALAIWFFVRAPEGSSAGAIFNDVERTGRAREVVFQTARAINQLASLGPDGSQDTAVACLDQIKASMTAAERLTAELRENQFKWIPVAEAVMLLEDCGKAGQRSLEFMQATNIPHAKAAKDELTNDLHMSGMTPEAVNILEASASQLLTRADQLKLRVQQSIVAAMFVRGKFLGFESSDLLLAVTVVAGLLSISMITLACRRLSIPSAKIEQTELELIGRTDRPAAMRQCHDRINRLLELANHFYRDEPV